MSNKPINHTAVCLELLLLVHPFNVLFPGQPW